LDLYKHPLSDQSIEAIAELADATVEKKKGKKKKNLKNPTKASVKTSEKKMKKKTTMG
jgi:hypothetical protein